jgi:hypothetical protein
MKNTSKQESVQSFNWIYGAFQLFFKSFELMGRAKANEWGHRD